MIGLSSGTRIWLAAGMTDIDVYKRQSTERSLYYPAVFTPFDTLTVPGYDSTFLVMQRDVSPIPEPTSIALLGLGLLGLVSFRRRSKTC